VVRIVEGGDDREGVARRVTAEITIRPAESSDAAAIAELQNRAYGPAEDHIIEQPPVRAEELLHRIVGGQWIVAAAANGKVVGSACLSRRGAALLISEVAVEPLLHRQGIGRALMRAAEKRASELGSAATVVSVLSARADSLVPYYGSQGYEEVGRRPLASGQGLKVSAELIIMEKPVRCSAGD
jgi:predicted N-acetyltransferase YhbS